MRQLLLCTSVFLLLSTSCDKTSVERISDQLKDGLVDMPIRKTTTPAVVIKGKDIVSQVQVVGPDLCYKFSKFEIKESGANQYEIRAKGTYPKGPVACAQALYYLDTTVTIPTANKGLHVLRFYYKNNLFKADSVQVN